MKTTNEDWARIDWLASYPKSGNTWLRCLVEAYFRGSVDINGLRYTGGDDHIFWENELNGDLLPEAPDGIRMLQRTFGLLYQVEGYINGKHDVPMIVKTHTALVNVDGQDMLPPTLTKSITYLVRDPRTVLPSFAAHFNLTIKEAIEQMNQNGRMLTKKEKNRTPQPIMSWGANVDTYLKQRTIKDILFIKYEDLKDDTEKWFSMFLEHIGEEVDAEKVKRAIELTSLDKLKAQEAENGFQEKPAHTKEEFFGGRRKRPSSKQLEKVVELFEPQMKAFNYI